LKNTFNKVGIALGTEWLLRFQLYTLISNRDIRQRVNHNFRDELPLGQKLALGLPATITLEVVPFRAYGPIPMLLPVFKYMLEIVFLEGLQQRLRFHVDHLNCENGGFSVLISIRGNGKVRWVGDDSRVGFCQKLPRGEGNMGLCVVIMQQPAFLSPEFTHLPSA
jgi:hypothetical protein